MGNQGEDEKMAFKKEKKEKNEHINMQQGNTNHESKLYQKITFCLKRRQHFQILDF